MRSQGTVLERTPVEEPRGDDWVHRFGLTERFAHWWTVLMVSTALVTGLSMGDEGGESGPMFVAHWGAVVLIGVGLLAAFAVGDTRALLHATWKLFSVDRRDATWMRDHLRHPIHGSGPGHYGMFNPGQKALAWALTVAVSVVILTGILAAWADGSGGTHATAVVVAMVLLGAHVVMAALNPATNHALHGMVFGRVRRSWAAKHHGGWLEDQSDT